MKTKFTMLLFIAFTILISGCTLIPHIPKYKLHQGDKIGYLIDIPEYPVSNHEGVEKEYQYKWYLQEYTENALKNSFKDGNYEFINLHDYNMTKEDLAELYTLSREQGKWLVPESKQEIYKKLDSIGLKGVISIYNEPKPVDRICGALGCIPWEGSKYGTFSNTILGIDRYIAATPFSIDLYTVNPDSSFKLKKAISFINANAEPPVVKSLFFREEGFIEPKDINNWTEKEMEVFKIAIEKYLTDVTKTAAELLMESK